MTEEQYLSNPEGCIAKFLNSWQWFLTSLQFKHPVHPLDPAAPDSSEFIVIDSKVRLRIIHVTPESHQKVRHSLELHHNKRTSLSEEYWFSKWNKPLKIGHCNCSFRRSQRYSLLSNQALSTQGDKTRESLSTFDVIPKRIVNVETFVERIIQETIFEAFQEYYILQNQTKGIDSLGFQKVENDVDEVILRKPKFIISKQPRLCVHKKSTQKKTLVLLLHGIGSSADVWWSVIITLVNRGYEVVAPDLLGHGYSSAPNQAKFYSFHSLLIHAITIFDYYVSADDRTNCILIGHSYGCSIATALYQHRASQISQLILISGGGPTPLAAPVKNNEISPFGVIHTLFKPLLFCGLKRGFLFSSRGKHFASCDLNSGVPRQILDYIAQGQNWPEGDAAFHRRILVPTLLVHGLQDQQVTLVQQCEMERTIPRAFLELIPNGGHMTMFDTPEHLSHMIMCFVESWN